MSENTPVPTETVTTPESVVGVIVKLYPVALSVVNPVAVAFERDTSLSMNPVDASVVVAVTVVVPVIVLERADVRVILGRIVSNIPVRVIPEATTGLAVLPEYTIPLKDRAHCCQPVPLRFRSIEPVDSHQLADTKEPVAVFPEPSIAVIAMVFPALRLPLREKPTQYAQEFDMFT